MLITNLNTIPQLPAPAIELLPAVHTTSIIELSGNLPSVGEKTNIYKNNTTQNILIPAGGGYSPRNLKPQELVAWSGSYYYKVKRKTNTNSFYPAMFDRVAYTIPFTAESLAYGKYCEIVKAFTFRAIGAATLATWSVIFEFGQQNADTSPSPVGPNIASVNYLPPALEQKIMLSDITSQHSLGIKFKKNIDGSWTGVRSIYSKALPLIAGTMPNSSEDFVLRIRIGYFDIENTIENNNGFAAYLIEDKTAI